MHKIRDILDYLVAEDSEAINRLCEIRGVGGRGSAAKCESLARSYRTDHIQLFKDLRKDELVLLLTTCLEPHGYYLPSARSYAKDHLIVLALMFFRDGELPAVFESVYEDDEPDEEGEDDEGYIGEDDRLDYRGEDYQRGFGRELAYSEAEAMRPLRRYQEQAAHEVLGALDPEVPKILHLATGGGKTRVANTIATRWLASRGGPVLWVTKDWRLLKQAAGDVSKRHRGVRLARLGGDGSPLHPLPSDEWGDFVYSTVQTVARRLPQGLLSRHRPKLLVWDECHWGEHGRAGKILTACKRNGIPVLGLTATPRTESRYDVAFSKTFRELVDEGFLARPVVQLPVRTEVHWSPELRRGSDVTRRSLMELANNSTRNAKIVEHYAANVTRYEKTIVFACSIEHVDHLTELFSRRGFAVRAVHSGQPGTRNERAFADFKSGAVQVLVNMEMLTHGVDVPDARTVFLCRPTTSDILFAQMIGRAARRDEATGKNSFFVVEFTDNISEHGELFESAQRYFSGSGFQGARPSFSSSPSDARRARLREHGFDPLGAPTWIPDHPTLPESTRGLWFRQGQTFGIEFELTTHDGHIPRLDDAWVERAEELRTRLAAALPGLVSDEVIKGYAGSESDRKDTSLWNVEYDSSAGWEVTSRILASHDGFIEVDSACRVLDEAAADLGLRVNHRTGTHVHIGWLGRDVTEVKRALQLARLFEPALATLVAPSRVVHLENGRYDITAPNVYCRPVSTVFSKRVLERIRTPDDIRRIANADEARYVTFNVRPLSHLHTVEVRLHHGTIEARKILLWVSLWQQLLWAAAHQSSIPDVPDVAVIWPDGDIVRLASNYLPDARQPQQSILLQRLHARRQEIRERQWMRTADLSPWVAATQYWASRTP